jgi:hypothetical protein
MSAQFDGREIWTSRKVVPVPMSKEQQEKWDKIQAFCKEVAAFSVQFAKEEGLRWAKTRAAGIQ